MARNSGYYGNARGAKVVELRRGSVHHVEIGSVERFAPADVAIRGTLKFRPSATIQGKPARDLAAKLSQVSIAHQRGELSADAALAANDAAIAAATDL